VTPFALASVEDKSGVTVIVDSNVYSTNKLAFRAFSASNSMFVDVSDLKSFLQSQSPEHQVLDFTNLSTPTASTPAKKEEKSDDKEVLIGMTVTKEDNFPKWYEQVLTRTEMMDYYDVSGCYIIRPYAFAIWKKIQGFFGGEIEELGVEDCYFPMFVTEARLNKEKDHIEGFSPEVAWVT
jgi:prolyl-tRNA synthetase